METMASPDDTETIDLFGKSKEDENRLPNKVEALGENITNPYVRLRYWIKEESLDLHALL